MKRRLRTKLLIIDDIENDSQFRMFGSRPIRTTSTRFSKLIELPKPSSRYSYPVFQDELIREIRYGLFGEMSIREWEAALANKEIVVSPSGAFVTVNATCQPCKKRY